MARSFATLLSYLCSVIIITDYENDTRISAFSHHQVDITSRFYLFSIKYPCMKQFCILLIGRRVVFVKSSHPIHNERQAEYVVSYLTVSYFTCSDAERVKKNWSNQRSELKGCPKLQQKTVTFFLQDANSFGMARLLERWNMCGRQ